MRSDPSGFQMRIATMKAAKLKYNDLSRFETSYGFCRHPNYTQYFREMHITPLHKLMCEMNAVDDRPPMGGLTPNRANWYLFYGRGD